MGTLITFENVGKIYHTGDIIYEALHDVNLTIDEGEMVVILGPSGAGKSTLLNMLGGLDAATSGRITFGEKEVTALNDKELGEFRAVDVGIIFQFYNLIPTLTAVENVSLMSELGIDIMDPKEALERVGLGDRLNNFPSQMSGGQQQRTSIGRALITNPALVLADEPTGNLDSKASDEIVALLKKSNKEYHQTIIMITHNLEIAACADRMIKIEDGHIV